MVCTQDRSEVKLLISEAQGSDAEVADAAAGG